MGIGIDTLIQILTLAGGSGVAGWAGWRYAKRKASAEATEAEAASEKAKYEAVQASIQATKEVQDSYQQLLSDMKTDREDQRRYADEQKQYIEELKEDRRHLREERDELRDRQDKLEKIVRDLQREVARNGRMVDVMRPFLCGLQGCKNRIDVAFPSHTQKNDDTGFDDTTPPVIGEEGEDANIRRGR